MKDGRRKRKKEKTFNKSKKRKKETCNKKYERKVINKNRGNRVGVKTHQR
jgi:hypothetical protein